MTSISRAPIPTTKIVSGFSRYKKQNAIYYGEQNILTFDTYLRDTYKKVGDEKVMLITKGVEYRPDLVAYDVYGIAEAWWKIMEVNNIFDVFNFKTGITIMLPHTII
jgi:hypothetical protein